MPASAEHLLGPQEAPRRVRRRVAFLLFGLLGAAATAHWLRGASSLSNVRERGAALFEGKSELRARMLGSEDLLPHDAVTCSNCHPVEAALGKSRDGASADFAPRLGPSALKQERRRRGGPPSRYDQAALCRVLRDGVDPAHIVIPDSMPRYDINEADCEALWTYLTVP